MNEDKLQILLKHKNVNGYRTVLVMKIYAVRLHVHVIEDTNSKRFDWIMDHEQGTNELIN